MKPRVSDLWFCPVTSLPKGFCTRDAESDWLLLAQKWIRKGICLYSLQHVLRGMGKTIKVGININCSWKLVEQGVLLMDMTRWKLCLHKIDVLSWCLWFLLACVTSLKGEGGTKNSKHREFIWEKSVRLVLYLVLVFLFPNRRSKKHAVFQWQ